MNNNIYISGTDARILLGALLSCQVTAPIKETLNLYQRLAILNQVQPPQDENPS